MSHEAENKKETAAASEAEKTVTPETEPKAEGKHEEKHESKHEHHHEKAALEAKLEASEKKNEELKNQYLKCSPFKFEGWCFNTGDGIKMVEDVGAKLWHMDMAISMYVSATAKSAERATLSRRRRPRCPAGGATALWPPALPRAAAQGALDRGVVEVRGPDLNLQRRGALGVPGRDRPARDLPSAELREPDRHRDVLCAERGQPPRGVRGPHDCPLSGSPSPSAASASRSFMR